MDPRRHRSYRRHPVPRPNSELHAVRWARQCGVLAAATGLLVRVDGAVWSVAPEDVPASCFVADEIAVPAGARRVGDEDLLRIRRAIPVVANARAITELARSGVPALRRWRTTDFAALVDTASAYAERLEWALSGAPGPPPPGGVLGDDVATESDLVARRAPALRPPSVRVDLRTASRLVAAEREDIAVRFLDTARARWWPEDEHLVVLESLAAVVEHARDETELVAAAALVRTALLGIADAEARVRVRAAGEERSALRQQLELVFEERARLAGPDERRCVLELLLATRGAGFSVPAAASSEVLHAVTATLSAGGAGWGTHLGDAVSGWLDGGLALEPWVASLAPALAVRTAKAWPVPRPRNGWASARGALSTYLGLLEDAGPPSSSGGRWLRQAWVPDLLVEHGSGGTLGLVVAASHADAGAEDAVSSLVVTLGAGDARVRRALREWSRPTVVEFAVQDFCASTGLDAALVTEYLHFRRIARDGEDLPRAVRSLADMSAGDRVEAHWVAELDSPDTTPARRELAAHHLSALRSPALVAAKRERSRESAHRRLTRGLGDYRLSALRRTLTDAIRRRLPDLSADLPLPLLAELVWLSNDDHVPRELLDRFVGLAAGDGTRFDWPENRAWAQRRSRDFDVTAWIRGFAERRDVGGRMIRYATEVQPLRAVHLGSWFDTCLALSGSGFNRFAALGHAIEANRHVVYAMDPEGNLVARKLLVLTADGAIVGYRSYAFADREAHRANMDELCRELAARCGAPLGVSGRPEQILDVDLWYDDGAEPWGHSGTPVEVGVEEDPDEADRRRWFAGELTPQQQTRAVELERERARDETWLDQVPLFDPDGFVRAVQRARTGRGRLEHLELPQDRRVVQAALAVSDDVASHQLLLVPALQAVSYLQSNATSDLSDLTLDVLADRGAPRRRLARAARVTCQRRFAIWGKYMTPDPTSLSFTELTDRRLRDRVADGAAQTPDAALELLRRGVRGGPQVIRRIVERGPITDARTAVAVAAAGVPWNSTWTFPLGDVDPSALRLAARGTLPPGALGSLHDFAVAAVGHPDRPPQDEGLAGLWAAARDLPETLDAWDRGDLGALGTLYRDGPGLIYDWRVLRRVAAHLSGPDDLLLALATALGQALRERNRYELNGVEPAMAVFAETVARGLGDEEDLATVASGLGALVTSDVTRIAGFAASLAPRLRPDAFLDLVARAPFDEKDVYESPSRWVLAKAVRDHPRILDHGAELTPVRLAAVAVSLAGAFSREEADRLIRQLAGGVVPTTLDAAVAAIAIDRRTYLSPAVVVAAETLAAAAAPP